MRYIGQIGDGSWVKGVARPVAFIRATPRDLCLSHGIEFSYRDGAGGGLGEIELAMLQTRSGLPYGLVRYPQAPRTDCTAIFVDEKLADVTGILNEILIDLELHSRSIFSFDLERYRFYPYRLMREDDYGNRTEIGRYNNYPDAVLEKNNFEHRGHKQFYSIEPMQEVPKGWTGTWQYRP